MRNNKHKDNSRPARLVTHSKKYWAGAKSNKPRYGTPLSERGINIWEIRDEWKYPSDRRFHLLFERFCGKFQPEKVETLEAYCERDVLWTTQAFSYMFREEDSQ